MLKIGIIGLGDIASKAYLPVISTRNAEVHLCTRQQQKLKEVARMYRFTHTHETIESLMASGIHAAFVHTSTSAHAEVVELLLSRNIHVYVDKPVAYDLGSTQKLFEIARQKELILFTGFNRRYAPAIQKLHELADPNMIVMQKNRRSLPADIRTFIFDDFIHVVDTLLYLFPDPVHDLIVTGKKTDSLLYHVVVQLVSARGVTALGIMNRDSGTIEESVEVFTPVDKWVVTNLTDTVIYRDKNELKVGLNDWEGTLYKRGFENMIDEFLELVRLKQPWHDSNALRTHELCEEIVRRLAAAD